jgi:hypothetical protein
MTRFANSARGLSYAERGLSSFSKHCENIGKGVFFLDFTSISTSKATSTSHSIKSVFQGSMIIF